MDDSWGWMVEMRGQARRARNVGDGRMVSEDLMTTVVNRMEWKGMEEWVTGIGG